MKRGRFAGTKQILQFNWPYYALLAPILGGGKWLLKWRQWPRPLKFLGNAGLLLGAWWALGAIVVSAWVYDFSPLMKWRWISEFLPEKPARWANFHAGLDESTPALREILGGEGRVFDFFDAESMTEPSIQRARSLYTAEITPEVIDYRNFPIEDDSLDAAFVLLAAHEIRDFNEREKLFAELHRVLDTDGTLIIAEHARDLANFAAFGPGAMHFFAPSEWEALGAAFELKTRQKITPFVRIWVWSKT